jgi:peptidoglycan/LPS O-acetylase OafA/YrhL
MDLHQKGKSSRYFALDGLRGIAAIAVLLFHITQHNSLQLLQGATIAVDLFFILSGFVVFHSFGKKIVGGMSFGEYLVLRLIRLWPLYIVGMLLGLVAIAMHNSNALECTVSQSNIIQGTFQHLFFIPYNNIEGWPHGLDCEKLTVFPINSPAWSLFFELFVSIVFYVYLSYFAHLNFKQFTLLTFAMVAITAFMMWYCEQVNPGWGSPYFLLAFPRALAEFFLGMWLYQYHSTLSKPSYVLLALVSVAMVAVMYLGNNTLTLIACFSLAPLLVLLLSKVEISKPSEALCTFLGAVSYPLYIIHVPVYRIVMELLGTRGFGPVFLTVVIAIVSLFSAALFLRLDDVVRPILSRLKRRMSHPDFEFKQLFIERRSSPRVHLGPLLERRSSARA